MQQVEQLKSQGNEEFNQKNYAKALNYYNNALKLIKLPPKDEEVPIYSTILSNRAATLLHLPLDSSNTLQAYNDACQVIQLRPDWSRGYLRKALAIYDTSQDLASVIATLNQGLTRQQDATLRHYLEKFHYLQTEFNAGLQHLLLIPGKHMAYTTGWTAQFKLITNLIHQFATSLQNIVHVVACTKTRQAMVLDPCWDVSGIAKYCKGLKLDIVAAFITHAHIDHVGGIPPPPFDKFKQRVPGLAQFIQQFPKATIYMHSEECDLLQSQNPEIKMARLTFTKQDDVLKLGQLEFKVWHTPGHTKGSQTLVFSSGDYTSFFPGDTIFPGSCGRFDFDESNADDLKKTLEKFVQEGIIWPAHDYGGEFTTVSRERAVGFLGPSGQVRFDEYAIKVDSMKSQQ